MHRDIIKMKKMIFLGHFYTRNMNFYYLYTPNANNR